MKTTTNDPQQQQPAGDIDSIRRRLKLAHELPEIFGTGNHAADRWRQDTTTLLAEIDRLQSALTTPHDHPQP